MTTLQITLCHSDQDARFAQRFAEDLRLAGATVMDASADSAGEPSNEPADVGIMLLSPDAVGAPTTLARMRAEIASYERGDFSALLFVTIRSLGDDQAPVGWQRIPTIDATGAYDSALQAIISALQERLPKIAARRAADITGIAANDAPDTTAQGRRAERRLSRPTESKSTEPNAERRRPGVSRRALVVGAATAAVVAAVGATGGGVAWLRGRTVTQRPGARRWYFLTGGFANSSPVVSDGVVYVGSTDKNLYAVDAATGAMRWQVTLGEGISTPTVAGGMVYALTSDGYLTALDARTGARHWRLQVGAKASFPTAASGTVYVIAGNKALYALDAATDATQRKYQTPLLASGAFPTVADGVVYVTTLENQLLALDVQTSAKRWSAQLDPSNAILKPTVANGLVYVAYNKFRLSALDATTGKHRWDFGTVSAISGPPVEANGALYVTSQDSPLQALDAATSTPLWSTQAGSLASVAFTPAVAAGAVYFVSASNEITAASAANGSPRWQFQTSGAIAGAPAAGNGLIYVTSTDTALYAINA